MKRKLHRKAKKPCLTRETAKDFEASVRIIKRLSRIIKRLSKSCGRGR